MPANAPWPVNRLQQLRMLGGSNENHPLIFIAAGLSGVPGAIPAGKGQTQRMLPSPGSG